MFEQRDIQNRITIGYVHTVNESSAISDIEASIQLLATWLEEAHTRSYKYSES